jgi:hypothetical protein
MIISSHFPFIFLYLYLWLFIVFWTKVPFTLGNDLEFVGWDWWFFINSLLFYSATRKHEISSEYLLKLCSLYYYCRTIVEAWKVESIFFNIWFSMIFSLCNFRCEVILKRTELYLLSNLKSCNLKCN